MNSICDQNEILRNRYFHGMRLTTKDLQAEQDYCGKVRLSITFEKKISEGRHNW